MSVGDSTAISIESQLRAGCLEMEQRVRRGEECSAEHILALYPELSDDTDSALELILAEFALRRERGEQTAPYHWYQRFPQWRERLERLFHVYELMGAEASLTTEAEEETVGPKEPLQPGAALPGEARRIGSYEVLGEIARGGMGVVYRARHVGLNRLVALKLILAGEHSGAEQRSRFRHEAEAAARLQHPNIVQIYEIGQQDGLPFLAMEYVAGPRLDQFLSARRAEGSVGLPLRQAAELAASIARAMHHAHGQGIVHRDLKPANILLQSSNLESENSDCRFEISDLTSAIPKIIDFGLAKTLNESQTQTRTGALLGTPCYMAPEQAAGQSAEIGPATDVFALGVMLYELLTGCLPFQGTSLEDTLEQVRSVEPFPPSQLQRNVPHDLQTICLKCLQKEPAKRYGSAEALAGDLQRFLDDEPILARPVGRIERTIRWCRRNRVVAALAGGIALLLVCGTAVATTLAVWALSEKEQARKNAEQERAARELADYRFAQAERAVENYLDGIERDDRLKEADFLELRKQLLASAVPFYEDFIKAKPGDAKLESKRGLAYGRLGSIHSRLGEYEQAVSCYRLMWSTFQKLADDFPQVPEYRRDRAFSHEGLGTLLRQLGRQAEAETELQQAVVLWTQLIADFPQVPDYRQYLGRTLTNLGDSLFTLGNRAEAEAVYRQAIVLHKRLVVDFPEVANYRWQLANSHKRLGFLLQPSDQGDSEYRDAHALLQQLAAEHPESAEFRDGLAYSHAQLGSRYFDGRKWVEAEAELRQALSLGQSLVATFPNVPDYQYDLVKTRNTLGRTLGHQKKPREAEAEYRQAVELGTQLVKRFANLPAYQNALGRALHLLAEHLKMEGELAEARRLYEQAIEHQSQAYQTAPEFRGFALSLREDYFGLAGVTQAQEDHAATAEAGRLLAQVRPEVAGDAYWAARFLGRCISLAEQDSKLHEAERQTLARSYADQAMDHLHEAVHRGFTGVKQLKTLGAFAPLRKRSDFQQLIQNLYRVPGAEEGEKLSILRVTEGAVRMQPMISFVLDRWSGDQQLYWEYAQPGARLDLEIPVSAAGNYDLEMVLTKAPDYGVVQLRLDDLKLGESIDLFNASGVVTTGVLKHSGLSLAPGRHVLSIEVIGANPAAIKAYMVGLDYVRILRSNSVKQ